MFLTCFLRRCVVLVEIIKQCVVLVEYVLCCTVQKRNKNEVFLLKMLFLRI